MNVFHNSRAARVACVVLGAVLLWPAAVWGQDGTGEAAPADPSPTVAVPDIERPDFAWNEIGHWAVWLWNLRVLRIGDADVRVSQIVFAIIIVLVGVLVARRLTRTVRERLVSRTPLDLSAAAAVEKLLFYVLLVIIALMALQTVQIPITIFTFLGGAVAIGLGFGAQNIFNNFISGLILMLDRPIRLGDTVEVAGHYGRIAEIGARCTRLRRFDGIDVLVPNSALVENDVVNWTLSDNQVRQVVRVGIAYGSDTRRAAELITQAVEERDDVLKDKSTKVVFEDFGDNALIFDAYFWVELSESINMRMIRSDVRFRIDELFREADITIAYPQRDVHLDTLKPLEVRMVESPKAPAS